MSPNTHSSTVRKNSARGRDGLCYLSSCKKSATEENYLAATKGQVTSDLSFCSRQHATEKQRDLEKRGYTVTIHAADEFQPFSTSYLDPSQASHVLRGPEDGDGSFQSGHHRGGAVTHKAEMRPISAMTAINPEYGGSGNYESYGNYGKHDDGSNISNSSNYGNNGVVDEPVSPIESNEGPNDGLNDAHHYRW